MAFTIATINVNGIRAAVKQRSEENLGFIPWVNNTEVDVIVLQEVRANEELTRKALAPLLADGWQYAGHDSTVKKGHAGVGILSRYKLADITTGMGSFTDHGRLITATIPDLGIAVGSLYLPSGSAGTAKQDEKYRFLDELEDHLAELADSHEHMVIGGDWNICHRRQDLKNDKSNTNKAGFLPDERAFMDAIFGVAPDSESQVGSHGEFAGAVDYVPTKPIRTPATTPQWVDVARELNGDCDGPYTWWTYRGKAFDTDAGWRIDLQAATPSMARRAQSTRVDKAERYDLRWSDHSPLLVTYQ
ncbi:exodeoxyribonuclease III [Corynebacterium choanae]|nr:exodeoxyribonuclease III [Corynebacterium choanae]